MAAEREPASIIAAQLRHADGGALAQRVYIHQLPQTAPRLAGVTRWAVGVGRASGGGKLERKPALKASLTGNAAAVSPQLKYGVAGTGFEPV
jgi:hypothetical protein